MNLVSDHPVITAVILFVLVFLVLPSIRTVDQGYVAVTTIFGKYRRVMRPGIHVLVPLVEKIFKRISIQNRSTELEFQAITQDQANVYFKAMLLWSVVDDKEEVIKNVAFKFLSEQDLKTALERSVEGATRGFVALRKQSEILSLRSEIVAEVKNQLDDTLQGWGYHLIDLQLNDIKFDDKVTESMAQVVASMNLKAAATNEGDALLIKKTKEAEANGAMITIAAQAEKKAAELRGEGVALFREKVSLGLARSSQELRSNSVDDKLLLFSIWTEALTNIAEKGKGNVIFFDGSSDSLDTEIKRLMGLNQASQNLKPEKGSK